MIIDRGSVVIGGGEARIAVCLFSLPTVCLFTLLSFKA